MTRRRMHNLVMVFLFSAMQSTLVLSADTSIDTLLNQTIETLRNGEVIADKDRILCSDAFAQYYEALSAKQGHGVNYGFTEPDRTAFYVNAVKMTLIDPKKHGGWPFRSTLKAVVFNAFRKHEYEGDDPYLLFAMIFPAAVADREVAGRLFEKLRETDAFLADQVISLAPRSRHITAWLVGYFTQRGEHELAERIGDHAVEVGRSGGDSAKDEPSEGVTHPGMRVGGASAAVHHHERSKHLPEGRPASTD